LIARLFFFWIRKGDESAVAWVPIVLDFTGRRIVSAGGGDAAARKLAAFVGSGARIRVVSPEVSDAVRRWAEQGLVEWLPRAVECGDVEGADLVVAATGTPETDAWVRDCAARAGAWAIVASDGSSGTAMLPAVVRRGRWTVAVSTGGASPTAAREMAAEWADRLDHVAQEALELMARYRESVVRHVGDPAMRRRLLRAFGLRLAEKAVRSGEGMRLAERLEREVAAGPQGWRAVAERLEAEGSTCAPSS